MSSQHELMDVLKRGPLQQGECLMVINHQTFRFFIRNFQLDLDFGEGIPEFTLTGFTFDNATELTKEIYSLGRSYENNRKN